jgi:hypothetical protein
MKVFVAYRYRRVFTCVHPCTQAFMLLYTPEYRHGSVHIYIYMHIHGHTNRYTNTCKNMLRYAWKHSDTCPVHEVWFIEWHLSCIKSFHWKILHYHSLTKHYNIFTVAQSIHKSPLQQLHQCLTHSKARNIPYATLIISKTSKRSG